ncbi:tyrosine-type recombinase/integrase [Sutcliffiella horikoshii]|uniref:tyrosine-type recombinase/integrase n=1 Tax=Sutcliffiella horikoshii TaxID=79883 RepID=UPI003CE8B555
MPIYPYEKNGKEHWYYAFEVKDADGKRKTIKKRGFDGKTKARKAEAEAKVTWERGSYIDPSKVTLGEYITKWLENKRDISLETRSTNEGHLRNHILPIIGSIQLQKVSVSDIEKLIESLYDKGLADGTVRKVYNLVNTCFKVATKKELLIKNPFDLLEKGDKPKKGKAKFDYWTTDEVKHFFKVLDHRQRIMFVLAIRCGMRRSEICGLRWKDINFSNKSLSIIQTLRPQQGLKIGTKSSASSRSIALSETVIIELQRHRKLILEERLACDEYQDNDLVVCQPNGLPVSLGNFDKFWKRIIKNTGMRYIKFHELRHTCASLLLSAGVHPKVVKELLGHSSISITIDTYTHLMPNMQLDAVNTLDKMLN